MYNRYIPQPDGSYRKKRIGEPLRTTASKSDPPNQVSRPEPVTNQDPPCPPPQQSCHNQHRHPPCIQESDSSITGFLKRLLPRELDTGDLMVILLLLLMSTDCPDDQNTALLTLVLYLFM